jgi:hypothetical protein
MIFFPGSDAPSPASPHTHSKNPEHGWETTMPSNPTFPGSVEIKRVIAAAIRAGIEIGLIEIHPRKIIIHPRNKNAPQIGAYEIWKMSRRQDTDRVKHAVKKSDALPKKSRS